MADLAIDYAWQHPNPSEIAKAGYRSVLRYLSLDPTKNITQQEVTALHAAGLSIGLIWETTAQRALEGSAAGLADGNAAIAQVRAIDYPHNDLVFANIGDWAVAENEIGSVKQYYAAFRAVVLQNVFKPGGYATSWVINQMVTSFPDDYWQNAMDNNGIPGDVVNPHAAIYQRVTPTLPAITGGGYDEDVILKPVALWGVASIPGGGSSSPTPPPTAPDPYAPAPGATAPPFPGRLIYLHTPYMQDYLHTPYMQGDDIRSWQNQMKARGWNITVDGFYGPQSETVCKQFQQEKHLTVDGIIGPITWNASWTYPVTS